MRIQKSIVACRRLKEQKILSLNWGELGGNLLIGGGLDGEEEVIACAKEK